MRLFAVALVAPLLASCGSGTNAPGSSGESPTLAQPTVSTVKDEPDLKPPPIFLVSAAGKQQAVPGSSCVSYVDRDTGQGTGACGDVGGPQYPDQATVVRSGEHVIVAVPGTTLEKDSAIAIRPLGCTDQLTTKLDLPQSGELHWAVDLEESSFYQLDVFARFETDDGRNGDVSGTLGRLIVEDSKAPALGPLDPGLAVCPFQP